jgi:enoyl-CoA hydratase
MPAMKKSAPSPGVLLRKEGAVATITLNRPAKLNTMTRAMTDALIDIIADLNRDGAIRAAILTGAGERAFCAGSDVYALDDYGSDWEKRNRREYCRELLQFRKPLIGAIRGYALGGGLELACCCDIRIASETATFGAVESKLGWHGGGGITQILPRLLGPGHALRLLYTGDKIGAAEAADIGLVQQVVPNAQLEAAASELAARIAANAPLATQVIKMLVNVAGSAPLDVGLRYENDTFFHLCFHTEDAKRGIAALKERRPAKFEGD